MRIPWIYFRETQTIPSGNPIEGNRKKKHRFFLNCHHQIVYKFENLRAVVGVTSPYPGKKVLQDHLFEENISFKWDAYLHISKILFSFQQYSVNSHNLYRYQHFLLPFLSPPPSRKIAHHEIASVDRISGRGTFPSKKQFWAFNALKTREVNFLSKHINECQ